MSGLVLIGILVSVVLIGAGLWLCWELLCQNGRILLRLDELEKRLDELEVGAEQAASGLPLDGSHLSGPADDDRAARFRSRSLAKSKIKRDGLKAGTPAPNFRLPRLDGRREFALEELRGRRLLLIFSDPHCAPCNHLALRLEEFHRSNSEFSVVMISRGEPKENRVKVKEHGLTFPVVLQQHWEVSRLYAMFATPVGYLIDEEGNILHDAAVGVEPILRLMARAVGSFHEPVEALS